MSYSWNQLHGRHDASIWMAMIDALRATEWRWNRTGVSNPGPVAMYRTRSFTSSHPNCASSGTVPTWSGPLPRCASGTKSFLRRCQTRCEERDAERAERTGCSTRQGIDIHAVLPPRWSGYHNICVLNCIITICNKVYCIYIYISIIIYYISITLFYIRWIFNSIFLHQKCWGQHRIENTFWGVMQRNWSVLICQPSPSWEVIHGSIPYSSCRDATWKNEEDRSDPKSLSTCWQHLQAPANQKESTLANAQLWLECRLLRYITWIGHPL